MGKYYAVRSGKRTGIFLTWDECKAQINGYSGAEYKSFKTEAEAKEYMKGAKSTTGRNNTDNKQPQQKKEKNYLNPPKNAGREKHGCLVAYVDGSYNSNNGKIGGGCVFFFEDKHGKRKFEKTETASLTVNDESVASMRNVAGEIAATLAAFQKCQDFNAKKLIIFHDYTGISCWCTRKWKAKTPYTKQYVAEFEKLRKSGVSVSFMKVEAHTGDKFNEMADSLAKQATY